MADQSKLILVLEEIQQLFFVKLLDSEGSLYSFTNFSKHYDIVYIRNLLLELSEIFGGYDRVVFTKDFRTVWDHEVGPHVFGAFIGELFASEYHSPSYESSDFDYYSFVQFTEFLEKNKDLIKKTKSEIISDDELPF